ncbi:MAG: type II toxin-antitoxin system PemK/MazF family toxin [Anaerolineae bacterium]|jgi:mRNA interferase MazF|uniref:type II toxin-antitoxin system PemK/MazF family toxin n=1 Tax=Candidatus Amarolinea dominans TaxID=3140696 RepID=UPI001E082380|nr:type II toxin-antitoxin system PemK/MazF family toxin [Anaerolineae bacterium]MBK7200484.1 type II toxin-antitoxin system PemK/MazF family toxin [Anaerolineae bacterium]MBK9092749.1 type II toxin-antitoxin system PemK/MazF family toxin [Anaerolineae bacterium]MBK9230831.1 type II toxin-antitoxin system PemK/MazF family toxin [Anaerolineae bacterium]
MRPGDLVLVRFPQTDLRTGKLRPALVVALAPGPYSDVLLALVTSREHQVIPGFDEVIQPTDPDFPLSRLKIRSVIRLARLATVDPAIIEARLGSISPDRLARIRNRLTSWLKP